MRMFLAVFLSLLSVAHAAAENGNVIPYESVQPAVIKSIRQSCRGEACRNVHAVMFVHGIFGSDATFKNGSFDWRENLPAEIDGTQIDVYSVSYETELLNWLKKDIASLDEVVYALFHGIQSSVHGAPPFIKERPYKSVGFIGHSLGSNISIAYLHTVKTERGHEERARHPYVITLGAPTTGAQIANVGSWIKRKLLMQDDKLLESLQRDNTFLRMLAHWRYSENLKAQAFRCRAVNLHMAREGKAMYGIPVVPDLGRADFAIGVTPRTFDELDHEELAKPAGRDAPVYKWVDGILKDEIRRVNAYVNSNPRRIGKLCDADPSG